MTWYHFAILAGVLALVSFLIVHFFLRISNDYADIKHRYQLPSCESCSDTTCVCDMGLTNGEGKGKSGRREQVPGKDKLPETDQKTLNVEQLE
jgi:hypothetical protein